MADAKRTPYREQTHVREPRRSARGTVVKRVDEPEDPSPTPGSRAVVPGTRVAPIDDDPDAGVFSGLVSPHPRSTREESTAQWALTLTAAPLILSTLIMVGWFDTRRAWSEVRESGRASRPMGIAHPFAWLVGAIPIAIVCLSRSWPWPLALVLVVLPLVALFSRRWLRRRIADREALLAMRRKRR